MSPRQDGHKRVYMREEVVEISVIAELRRKGFSLQKIRRVLRFLQKDMGKRLSEALQSAGDVHLLTDGKSIYLEEAPNRIIDLLKKRPSADVPGLRNRSGKTALVGCGAQTGQIGNRHAYPQSASGLSANRHRGAEALLMQTTKESTIATPTPT